MSHRTSWIKLFSSAGGTAGGIAPGAVGRGWGRRCPSRSAR